MSFNLKDALNGLFMKVKYTVPADYNQFAVNMYLGKYKQYIPILEPILTLKLPNEAHFKYLQKKIGYGWPMKADPIKEEKDVRIEYLMRFYECSRLDAVSYLKFITKQQMDDIIDYYKEE